MLTRTIISLQRTTVPFRTAAAAVHPPHHFHHPPTTTLSLHRTLSTSNTPHSSSPTINGTAKQKNLRPDQIARHEAKQLRRDTFLSQQRNKEKRRARQRERQKNKGIKQRNFNDWWEKRKGFMDIVNKEAWREGLEWKMKVAVLVERSPIVTPDMPDWEVDFVNLQDYRNSFDIIFPPPFGPKDQTPPPARTLDDILSHRPPSRRTTADRDNDFHSPYRHLPERLYLAVKSPRRWTFPITSVRGEETLLEASARVLEQRVGVDNMEIWKFTKQPIAVDMRVYEGEKKEEMKGFKGEKLFYFLVMRMDGNVDAEEFDFEDYAWLTREEMVERVRESQGEDKAIFYGHML